MHTLQYLAGYPEHITRRVNELIAEGKLGSMLAGKYPSAHGIRTEKALYAYTVAIKNEYLRTAAPLSKVLYDGKLHAIHQALGTHTFISRIQGSKLKAKHEIRISAFFKNAPLALLRMIVVHELAHLKEKEHNRSFYQLCRHMEPDYQQLEFDTRLLLTHRELGGHLFESV